MLESLILKTVNLSFIQKNFKFFFWLMMRIEFATSETLLYIYVEKGSKYWQS